MKKTVLFLAALAGFVPLTAAADISAKDLPADTVWYFHADLSQMRTTDAGRELYGWLEDEVIVEINDELKIDLNREIDRITAFSNDGSGIVAIFEGAITQDLRDKVLAMAFAESGGGLEQNEYRDMLYYKAGDDEGSTKINGEDAIRHSGYFTFGVEGKILMASAEEQIRALIDSGGRIPGAGQHDGALFILSADKQFVQAGVRTAAFADDDDDWNSNILRNTEQAALLIADRGGLIALDVKLVSSDPEMTQSLGSIVNGVIALQAFSSDMEPAFADVLRNTSVNVDGAVLSVSTVLDPAVVRRTLGD